MTMQPIRSTLAALVFTASIAAHVTLSAPNGGERLIAGSAVTITWSNDIRHTTLFWQLSYSTTGPRGPWLPIAVDIPPGNLSSGAIHNYTWTVPATISGSVRVRIVQDNAGRDYEDMSDGDLSIIAAPPMPATFATAGQGCVGSAGVPTLDAVGGIPPRPGASFGFVVTNVPSSSPSALMMIGFGTRPPIDLAAIGMPSCLLRFCLVASPTATIAGNQASWSTMVPNQPTLIGLPIAGQAFVLDPLAGNGLGATVSNAGIGVVGV